MSRLITSIILATTLLAGTIPANAATNAVHQSCEAGILTPHGVWDCR